MTTKYKFYPLCWLCRIKQFYSVYTIIVKCLYNKLYFFSRRVEFKKGFHLCLHFQTILLFNTPGERAHRRPVQCLSSVLLRKKKKKNW